MADALTNANAIRLAKGCARDAALLTQQGSRNAAYLAEQALEQVVRAIATSEGLHIERADAHQLDKVVRRFPNDQIEKTTIESLTWLEAYATTFRYTLPADVSGRNEACECRHGHRRASRPRGVSFRHRFGQ